MMIEFEKHVVWLLGCLVMVLLVGLVVESVSFRGEIVRLNDQFVRDCVRTEVVRVPLPFVWENKTAVPMIVTGVVVNNVLNESSSNVTERVE